MVAVSDLVLLRRLIDEPDDSTYTDVELTDRLAAAGADKDVVALEIWGEKVVKFASLVDTSEGGSSRRNSQAFDHAKDMVLHFRGLVEMAGKTVIRKIARA